MHQGQHPLPIDVPLALKLPFGSHCFRHPVNLIAHTSRQPHGAVILTPGWF